MIKLNKNILKILLFVFLFLQVIPLLTRENMQSILIFDYSIILSIIFLISIIKQDKHFPIKYMYLSGLTIVSFLLYIAGFSGSISGFILSASVPFLLFNNVNTYEKLVDMFFPAIKWASVMLIIFGAVLYMNLQGQLNNLVLLSQYFIKASINYVSLLFYGFSMLFLIIHEIKKNGNAGISKIDYIIGVLLLASSAFYSAMYLTRSTFIASIILIVLFFREHKIIIFSGFILAFIIYKEEVYRYIIALLGTDSVTDLASQDVRVQSVNYLIKNSLNFNYDFTDTMSFSSLANLLFCLFPFTIYFAFDLVLSAKNILSIKKRFNLIFYTILFLTALFICIYQMDFLSIFVLFFCAQVITLERKLSVKAIKLNFTPKKSIY